MKSFFPIIFCFLVATSCQNEPDVETILQKSIDAHGGNSVYNSHISFNFRNNQYDAIYNKGNYTLTRTFVDSLNTKIKDVLTNTNFERTVNDTLVTVTDAWKIKYSNSINSVIYFFRLPFNLKDPATKLTLLGTSKIETKEYYKVKVFFSEEGGGEDFSDQFVYWFNTKTYTLDYFAYEYSTSGGGKRFRKAINQRKINGLLVSDYINYEPKNLDIEIEHYDTYFEEDGLKKLSEIVNKNVRVTYY